MPKSLPLVQLQLLSPIINGLRECGVNPDPLLEDVGLTMTAVETEGTSVHVMVVHQFVESCAIAAKDKEFCAKIGARLDPTGWPMVRRAIDQATTLGEFLNIYVVEGATVASSAVPFVEVRGQIATFGETRKFEPSIKPAQNDGFMIGLKITMLERVLRDQLDPKRVTIVMSDPSVLPKSFSRYNLLAGNNMGPRIQFPSEWLSKKIISELGDNQTLALPDDPHSTSFLSGLRRLLLQNIGTGGLKAQDAADLVQMSPKMLSRTLHPLGTNISKELTKAKIQYARTALAETDRTIESISSAIGYGDASNFTRAFVKEQSQSPKAFRKGAKPSIT